MENSAPYALNAFQCPNFLADDPTIDGNSLKVLLVFFRYMRGSSDNLPFLEIKLLCELTGLDEKTVSKTLVKLRNDGYVEDDLDVDSQDSGWRFSLAKANFGSLTR
jgi:DNA-binding transcriptional ArsR family regulator